MKIVFRVDASNLIGSGHVMRCLSLAEALRSITNNIFFACLPQSGDATTLIENRGFAVYFLTPPTSILNFNDDKGYLSWLTRSVAEDAADFICQVSSADLVITDHYAIGVQWHGVIKSAFHCNIVSIDDLGRDHEADLIIDQTLGRQPELYKGRGRVLAGPEYALLAASFASRREDGLDRVLSCDKPRVLIYMGGGDIHNVTLKVLEALVGKIDGFYTVLLSKAAEHYNTIKEWSAGKADVEHIGFVDDMATLMLNNDISIGAAGTSSWERACIGLPSILIPVADNQSEICLRLVGSGAAIAVDMESVSSQLKPAFLKLYEGWGGYSKASLSVCDGRGASRVLLEIEDLLAKKSNDGIELHLATEADTKMVYEWQALPETRRYALNSNIPTWAEHESWMINKLSITEDYFYIIKKRECGISCGVIRLDREARGSYIVSILVDPRHHGQGIGKAALSILDRIFPDVSLHAVVLEANAPSQKLFKKAGYKKISREKFIRKPIIRDKMEPYITIDKRRIGADYPPYIIAELSANHNGDINRAFQIMEAAKDSGADAIKLQTYTHDTITIDCDSEEFQIHGGLWDGQSLYQLYKEAHMPWNWHKPLFEKARELGITIFSSPFDFTAVDLLESLDAPAYKIASFELVDLPLIKRVAQSGKPMIMSTGMANKVEIKEAVETARENGCHELVILHCVSGYPAPSDQYNLKTIADIAKSFNVVAGLSDHTIDNTTAIASVVLGASVIEKHVTLDRNGGGADDSFSLEPLELKMLCRDSKAAWQAMGEASYKRVEAEKGNAKFRRSLYIVRDIMEGEFFSLDNVRSIRPGYGMAPKHLESVIGRRASQDLRKGTAMLPKFIK